MRISKIHVDFWTRRKSPEWVLSFLKEKKINRPTIDDVVNAHEGRKLSNGVIQAHNTLGILRSARNRGALLETLEEMSAHPGTVINPKRRAGFCRKWLARIISDRQPDTTPSKRKMKEKDMSQQDYHDAMVEAGKEAIEQGERILSGQRQERVEPVEKTIEKQRTLGDLLREAMERGLPKESKNKV